MPARLLALYLCFFLSGASALIYEVLWQRMLTLVFGVSTWSVTTVLAAFMAGLALGGYLLGRPADRARRPIRLYGAIEIGIALSALAVSFAIDPLMDVYVSLARGLTDRYGVHDSYQVTHLLRLGLGLAALIVPSTLIGATVPLMTRIVVATGASLGSGYGRLYAVNTFGSVIGAGLAGFILIRTLGVQASVYVAVAGNLVAGIIAFLADQPIEPAADAALDQPQATPTQHRTRHRTLMLLAGLGGFVALGSEVAWARLLAVYTLNSVYVFTMLLTVYLTGLAAGGAVAAWWIPRLGGRISAAAGIIQWLLALTAPLVLVLTQYTEGLSEELLAPNGGQVFRIQYLMTLVLVFLPTLLMGIALPMIIALIPDGTRHPGRSVGGIYAVNAVGTIFGALLAGVVLIPLAGIRATLLLFGLVSYIMGCVLWCGFDAPVTAIRRWLPIASTVMVALSLLAPFGMQFVAAPAIFDDAVLYYAEGNAAVVHVAQTNMRPVPQRTLFIDSQSVAGNSDALVIDQKMLAHLPLLLCPEPQRILTVGFGTGGTSYSMRLHDVVTHCVEIERRVPAAAHLFIEQNHGIVGLTQGLDPRRRDYRLILDDARSWLCRASEPYDAIVDDLTSIQYRGNGNLYTRECFQLMRDRLTEDGVGCAWLPITAIDTASLKMVVRTFQAVFPHTSVWHMPNVMNRFVILVGTPDVLAVDLDDWRIRMEEREIRQDLAVVGYVEPLKLASCVLLTDDEVTRFAGDGPLHTDDTPRLDYATHASLGLETLTAHLEMMLACQSAPRPSWWITPGDDSAMEAWIEAQAHVIRGHIAQFDRDFDAARGEFTAAANLAPGDATFARLAGRPGATVGHGIQNR